ncbi:MAG: pyroglutamyl-peptidase I [Azospirillum sp.]|nr:pyroglutamyl-peptidase I [Azospirillum sp.]
MARAPRILLTGFEVFGGHKANPSEKLALRLDGEWVGPARVVGRVFPVSIAKLDAALETLLAETKPVAIVALGLADDEATIRLETTGYNELKFRIPDNDGRKRSGRIEKDGPARRAATLPLQAIRKALLGAGIPARLSDDPGRFLCNAALYGLLGRAGRAPCGFVHLPPTPEMVAAALKKDPDTDARARASMGLRLQLAAIRLVLAETARKALK